MKRIDTSTRAIDLFGAGKDGFKDGNLALGVAPTDFNAAWPNGIQEEILTVIEKAGIAPSGLDLTQLMQAIRKLTSPKLVTVTATGNVTVPADTYLLDVEIWGGGGSGGGTGSTANGSASGGGSGGYARGTFVVAPGSVIPCTIGIGGDAATNTAGGASAFGALMTAGGGGAGSANTIGTGGAGGAVGTGGLINLAGTSGSGGLLTGSGVGGTGASAPFGGGGGGTGVGAPSAGSIPGGGGGGRGSASTGSGGAGARGQINIHY